MKVNELKLTQVELLSFFYVKWVAANASELFNMAHLANNKKFLYHSNLSFKNQIVYASKLASLSWWKSTNGAFF